MITIRYNNPAFTALLAFWKKHCTIEEWHIAWLKQNIEIFQHLSKGEIIYLEGEKQKNIYFVSQGTLARIRYDAAFKVHILSLALPEMALMSAAHLYSHSPSKGHIIALHANTSIVRIPYTLFNEFRIQIPELDTLVNILSNKKKKLLLQLRILSTIKEPIERYLWFAEHMQQLKNSLTHKEAAQLLGVSIDTVYRALRIWRNS